MKKNLILFFIFNISFIFACTIGVASGNITSNGKPIIWKNRDVTGPLVVKKADSLYTFVGVGNSSNNYIWMGINEMGLAFVNAVADFNRLPGNGDTMMMALGNCANIPEFEELLNETNISGRETNTMYAVLDALGNAKMYEVSANEWWSFDANEVESGFITRGNIAFYAGNLPADHLMSISNINQLLENNQLDVQHLLQTQIRDVYFNNEHIDFPFQDRQQIDMPFGYVSATGTANSGNGSAVVIEGVSSDEPAIFTTMWTLLSQPLSTCAVPVFCVDELSPYLNDDNNSLLYEVGQELRSEIFDFSASKFDTYKLVNEENQGFLIDVWEMEENIIEDVDQLKSDWLENGFNSRDIIDFCNQETEGVYNFLSNYEFNVFPIPEFDSDKKNILVNDSIFFYDKSVHYPQMTGYRWVILQNDNILDEIFDRDINHVFSLPGNYSIRFGIIEDNSYSEIVKENFITVYEDLESATQFSSDIDFLTNSDCVNGVEISISSALDDTIYINEINLPEGFSFEADSEFYITSNQPFEMYVFCDLSLIDISENNFLYSIVTNFGELYSEIHINPDLVSIEDNMFAERVNVQIFPNPVSVSDLNKFNIIFHSNFKKTDVAELKIFNIKGQCIKKISNIAVKTGDNLINWNVKDEFGRRVASGIYFISVSMKNINLNKKFIILE